MSEATVGGMGEAEAWAKLDDSFPLGVQGWRDLMAQPPADRDQAFRDMMALGALPWAHETTTLDDVESVLFFLANLANPVSAIAGGAQSVASLMQTLRGK